MPSGFVDTIRVTSEDRPPVHMALVIGRHATSADVLPARRTLEGGLFFVQGLMYRIVAIECDDLGRLLAHGCREEERGEKRDVLPGM